MKTALPITGGAALRLLGYFEDSVVGFAGFAGGCYFGERCLFLKQKIWLNRRRRHKKANRFAWSAAVLFVALLSACTGTGANHEDEFLIRVGDRIVTVGDFNKTFEIAKTAYPHNMIQNPELLKETQVRVLNQMIEEQILLTRAEELQIDLSKAEVDQAVSDIRKDYPEEVFEQMLLEYAVSYRFWEKRLQMRLLMEKVIARELVEGITISSEDIAKYYKETYDGKAAAMESGRKTTDINELVIRKLRRKMAEEAYNSWIKRLQERYTVEINSPRWERISGS